jgi:hypothetical protein
MPEVEAKPEKKAKKPKAAIVRAPAERRELSPQEKGFCQIFATGRDRGLADQGMTSAEKNLNA